MMRPVEDKSCYNHEPIRDLSSSAISFEFQKGNGGKRASHHRTALGKPTPSKWDDAQKWLVGFSKGGENNQSKTTPRNSNADDLRLIAPVPQKEHDYSSNDEEELQQQQQNGCSVSAMANQYEAETKRVDCRDSIWRINKQKENPATAVRSICVRDMGTEMTPIASQEPSRTATPIRATTPAARSPISSGSSTPARYDQAKQATESSQSRIQFNDGRVESNSNRCGEESNAVKIGENDRDSSDQAKKMNSLETRAMAWDEAERAKYMARFKREEMKIEAWENQEKRKAEMETKKVEARAERMKARAQEKMRNKVAATRRMAEEKRANAEAKLNEKAVITSEKADYVRRTGHLPSSFSFSFKFPSPCW